MTNILIADSGGSGTDWVYIDAQGNRHYFETESYHPNNWSDEFWSELEAYWTERWEYFNIPLHFYGAGCLNEENAERMLSKFQSVGFESVQIKSDLHAAGKSCYVSGSGKVAILGTGSVLFSYSNYAVSEIIGGKGHELGDEGSGFYFGKLIIEAYLSNSLNYEQRLFLEENSDVERLSKLKITDAKHEWASLIRALSGNDELYSSFHRENIQSFIQLHLTSESSVDLCLVGSYAFYNQELWKSELAAKGCQVSKIIQKPILHLID